MKQPIVVPTILTNDREELNRRLELAQGFCERIQLDVDDGSFAGIKTVSIEELAEIETGLKTELHLMVDEPTNWLNRALAVLPTKVVAQVEKMSDPFEFVTQASEAMLPVGLALDFDTPVDFLSEDLLRMVDQVLLLGYKAGDDSQGFNEAVLKKIEQIKMAVGDEVEIGIDGGVTASNLVKCAAAGADVLYVGREIWTSEDPAAKYRELTNLLSL